MTKTVLAIGLGFGDEGKGTCVDYITREDKAHTVVRFNGGAQAAHNVVLPDGKHHTFAQFGSGTFAGARTHLSRFMMVNPLTLWNEALHLKSLGIVDPYDSLTVEREALLTTPLHMFANRIREELRGNGRHGSCGLGIGETMSYSLKYPEDAIRVGDLERFSKFEQKLDLLGKRLSQEFGRNVAWDWTPEAKMVFHERCNLLLSTGLVDSDYLPEVMRKHNTVFEGAQGVLLDQDYGFHPYTTWSNTTLENALELIKDYDGDVTRLGIMRSYLTRHGPGPFPSHVPEMDQQVLEPHNAFGKWQREFRRGYQDLVLLRYALDVIGGVDEIAMTHMDWVCNPDVQYMAEDYHGIDFATSEVFGKNDYLGTTRIHVRKHDTMEEQMAWQSKITQALEALTLDNLSIKRHFKGRHPEGSVESALMGSDVFARVTLLSHGPTHVHKVRKP